MPTAQEELDFGPQLPRDPPFTARMRWHQSWYRAAVLQVPIGVGPEEDGRPFGNYLTQEDGTRGANFLTPAIFAVARERLALNTGVVEEYRLVHNLLSSQPMCFNLFGPLVDDMELATRLMAAVLPGEVAQVEHVAVEYAPDPASAYLGDRTAFDAFVAYWRPDGQKAFMGFETKLTEPFSPKHYDGPLYRRWMDERSPWRTEAGERVADIRHNQLWRDHLLAIALARKPGWAQGRLALVRHPLDRECETTAAGYQQLLRDGDDTFLDVPLDRLVQAWEQVARTDAERSWLAAFRLRYMDLDASAT